MSEEAAERSSRGLILSVGLPALTVVVVPLFGWIWRTENTITSMKERVEDLEQQVHEYRATEASLIEIRVHLENIQSNLKRGDAP